MALPTITSNSPTAGFISWTAFGVAFAGTNYPVLAGNTNKKFVWWEYRNGTPALVDGDAIPNLAPEDVLLFLNKNGVGALVPMTDVVDGSLIVSGSVMAAAIAADQIQTYHLDAGVVTANEIAAGAVNASHVAAGSITADKLSVGTVSDNLVVNGSFEDVLAGNLIGWEINALSNGTILPVTGQSSSGAISIQMAATTTAANLRFRQLPAQYIPVSAASGRKYYISVRAGASVATTSGHYMRANWYDGNKVFISSSDIRSNAALTTTFTLYEGQVTPPANAKYMGMEVLVTNLNVVSTVYIDEVSAHEVTMSAQIGDGQITTAKILAGNVTTDRLAAKAVTADKITVSDFTNYAPDPGFESGGVGWNITGWTIATIADPIVTGTKALQVVGSGAVKDASSDPIPVREGEWYYATCYVRKVGGTGGTVGTLQLGATVNRSSGGPTWPTFGTISPASLTNSWLKIGGPIQIPALATSLQVRPSIRNDVLDGTYQFDDVQLRRMNSGELIVDGSIVATKIGAEAVTAAKIQALAVDANKIAANAIEADKIKAGAVTATKLESTLVLASKIVAGPLAGTHAEIDPQGFKVYAQDLTDGIPNEMVRMGVAATDDFFTISDASQNAVATINSLGVISGKKLYAGEDLFYRGDELTTVLNRMPKGLVGWAQRTSYSPVNANSSTRVPYMRLNVKVEAGRFYKVTTSPIASEASDTTTSAVLMLNYKYGGDAGPFDSFFTNVTTRATTVNAYAQVPEILSGITAAPSDGYLSVMVSFQANGTGVVGLRGSESQPVWITVEDMGPQRYQAGVNLDGVNPAANVINYYTEYALTGASSYNGSNGYYAYMENKMFQGQSPAGQGNLKSIATFQSMTTDLQNATITDMRVFLNFESWYYNAGGTVHIGLHGFSTPPATFSHSTPDAMISAGWPRPGGRWVNIPSAYWAGFKAGTYKGISLSAPGGDYQYYGFATENAIISAAYTK